MRLVASGYGVEMVLKRMAQGTKTAGESTAVDGHDKSHRRTLVGAGLVVSAGPGFANAGEIVSLCTSSPTYPLYSSTTYAKALRCIKLQPK